MWYHYGCVGVEKHDPRLDSEAAFICPLCSVQSNYSLRNAMLVAHNDFYSCQATDPQTPYGDLRAT
ncbi:hypothetical protein EDD15DRAFT_2252023 [Pisolithus albus]|nr:hypothetical protein EDD15DRAFT_2252023 [Pisolithus albus]